MRKLIAAAAVASAGMVGPAAAEPVGALHETPPYFAPQFHFSYSSSVVPQGEEQTECQPAVEAEAYFERLRQGAPERGIPAETIVRQEGSDASRFISAAWSEKGVLPFAGAYADVDLVIVRTRPDIPNFAKVHFGSVKRTFVCNFVHPVIVTDERMRIGLRGIPQAQPWRKGDPYPGMSESERETFKMLFGLRNQLDRGNAEEREEALRGLGDLMQSPGSRLDKPYPSDLPPLVAPKPRPQFGPTPQDVERDMSLRPTCRAEPYHRDCFRTR